MDKFVGDESQGGGNEPPTDAELLSYTSSINTNTPIALTAGWVLITFLPWRFYTLLGPYFSHQMLGSSLAVSQKFLKTWQTLSQLCLNLAGFSAVWVKGVNPKHIRDGLSILEVLSWGSHTQFVTEKAANRRGYVKENHYHATNLDVSVFMFALEIVKGDDYWCETRHWPYFWTALGFFISARILPETCVMTMYQPHIRLHNH